MGRAVFRPDDRSVLDGHAVQVVAKLRSQFEFGILVEMLVFVLVLFLGFAYLWKKGAFDWD